MKAKILLSLRFFAGAVVIVALGWTSYATVRYLRTSSRFEVRRLVPQGLKHVTETQVLAAAGGDGFEMGMNVFAVDLDGVRARIEELRWVRHALVERILPDQITIKIVEREPVGLARVNGETRRFDIEGVLLEAPEADEDFSFPVLDGMRLDDPEGNRGRAETYMRTLSELGAVGLSEVRIAENGGNVYVVANNDPMLVNLGSEDFRARWVRYQRLKAEIRRQYPEAAMVDLRFRDQVVIRMTADGDGSSGKVKWRSEKRNAL
ncbi:MAG TPA: FtsQ-type POTRA domain-containing protein [Terriglobia bacterium]|nr:FtsQ-type POTRA domain-containing protein [Terriglobia bacterium]